MKKRSLSKSPKSQKSLKQSKIPSAILTLRRAAVAFAGRNLWSVGALVLIVALFLRTTGILLDEVNYLDHAVFEKYGDAEVSGKPILFYVLNHTVFHLLRRITGPFSPVILYFFYAFIFSGSLDYCLKSFKDLRHRPLVFFSLLLTPFVLLNATQVMMENLILSLLFLIVGRVERNPVSGKTVAKSIDIGLALLCAASMAVKPTILPALFLIGLTRALQKKYRPIRALGLGVVLGFAFNLFIQKIWFRPQEHYDFGGVSNLLDPARMVNRLFLSWSYGSVWFFFCGVFAWMGFVFWFLGTRSGKRVLNPKSELFIWIVGSLAMTFVFQLLSNFNYIRYTYPVIGLGLLASLIWLARIHSRVLWSSLAVSLIFSAPLFGSGTERFFFWPHYQVEEAFESMGTVFFGFRTHSVFLKERLLASSSPAWPCIDVEDDAKSANQNRRYLHSVFLGENAFNCKAPVQNPRQMIVLKDRKSCEDLPPHSLCRTQNVNYFTTQPGLYRTAIIWK